MIMAEMPTKTSPKTTFKSAPITVPRKIIQKASLNFARAAQVIQKSIFLHDEFRASLLLIYILCFSMHNLNAEALLTNTCLLANNARVPKMLTV